MLISSKITLLVSVSILLPLLTCCERLTSKKETKGPRPPTSFGETMITDVVPTADGEAYVIGSDSDIWYVRGIEAIRVRFEDLSSEEADLLIGLQIVPSTDGGAYAYVPSQKAAWHLHEGTAKRIKEVPSLHTERRPASTPNAFALYIAERKKRLQAEEELEASRNRDEDTSGSYDW